MIAEIGKRTGVAILFDGLTIKNVTSQAKVVCR